MCFPAAIPLALAAAGSGLNYMGNRAAAKASNRASLAEMQRQRAFEQEQTAAFDESHNAARRLAVPQDQQQAVDARRAAFIAALDRGAPDQGILPGGEGVPQVVADAAARADAGRRNYSEGQASSLAELTAMGDQLLGTNIAMNRAGQRIGQIGQSRNRSAQLLDGDLRAAANKGSTLRGLGTVLQIAGQAAGASGMGGGRTWMPRGQAAPLKFQGIY
jgi:hypothetical protein